MIKSKKETGGASEGDRKTELLVKDNDELKANLTETEKKIAELTAGWQRTQADFLNHKKQTEQDRARLIKSANTNLLEAILPVLDNFALATKHFPPGLELNIWAQGIKHIEKQLENILTNEGLTRIATVGQIFDPEFHEAIERIPADQPEGEIIEEVSPGYKFDNIVLRPAQVKVSQVKNHK